MKRLVLIMALPLMIGACSNVKKTLGMERAQPDEFAVVEGAPLTVPPNFDLMPPQPGAPRPQETKTSATAQNLILGTDTSTTTTTIPSTAPVAADPAQTSAALATSSLGNTADASLLSDAGKSASKPVDKTTATDDSAVLKPTDESQRLQQQNINTTTMPSSVMKSTQ